MRVSISERDASTSDTPSTTAPPPSCPMGFSGGPGDGGMPPSAGLVPGPEAMPLLGWRGNALRFFSNPIRYMTDLRETYGPIARLTRGGGSPLFFRARATGAGTHFVLSHELNREVLTQLDVFETRAPPGPPTRAYELLSTNLLFINGERHKQQRQLLMPAFKRASLMGYFDDIVGYTQRMVDRWLEKEQVDLSAEMNRVALEIGSKTLYGQDASGDDHNLAARINEMLGRLLSPVSMVPVNLPGSPYRRLIQSMDGIVEDLEAEIESKRAQGAAASDVLSMMVRAHDEDPQMLTDDELIGESFVMFFAGHDTTSKALVWTLFLLAQHPQTMARILDELDERLGDEIPTYEQIYELGFLDRAVKECLRLLPPAVLFPRVAVKDTRLGPYDIPAESEIIYSPYVTHPGCWGVHRTQSLRTGTLAQSHPLHLSIPALWRRLQNLPGSLLCLHADPPHGGPHPAALQPESGAEDPSGSPHHSGNVPQGPPADSGKGPGPPIRVGAESAAGLHQRDGGLQLLTRPPRHDTKKPPRRRWLFRIVGVGGDDRIRTGE